MKMNRLAILITVITIGVMASLSLASCAPVSAPTPTPQPAASEPQPSTPSSLAIESKKYYNSGHGFSVEYPSEWQLDEGNGTSIVAFGGPYIVQDGFWLNINIGLRELHEVPKPTLEEFVAIGQLDVEREFENVKVVDEQNTTIAGYPAIVKSLSLDYGAMTFMITQATFITDDFACVITYTATPSSHDQYYNCFDLVANTFKFE
jgi:hypothetical protein